LEAQVNDHETESAAPPSPYRPLLDRTVRECVLPLHAPPSTPAQPSISQRSRITDSLVRNHDAYIEGMREEAPQSIRDYNEQHRQPAGLPPLPPLDAARYHLLVTDPNAAEEPPLPGFAHVDWLNPAESSLYEPATLKWDSAFWADIRLRMRRAQIFDGDLDPADLQPAPTSQLYSGPFSLKHFKFNPVSDVPDPKETPLFGEAIAFVETGLKSLNWDAKTRFLLLYGPPGCGKTWTASWSDSTTHSTTGTVHVHLVPATHMCMFMCAVLPRTPAFPFST